MKMDIYQTFFYVSRQLLHIKGGLGQGLTGSGLRCRSKPNKPLQNPSFLLLLLLLLR